MAVGLGGRPCRLLTVTRCRRIEDLGVARRRRTRGSVGAQPGHHGFWSTDRQALLWHVPLHSIAQIGVELEAPGAGAQAAHARETRGNDFLHVFGQPHRGFTLDGITFRNNSSKAHGWCFQTTLRERHGTHAQAADPTGSRVLHGSVLRTRTAGQKELPARGILIHGTANHVPHLRHLLPLIDEERARAAEDDLRIRCDGLANGFGVQLHQPSCPLFRRRGLAYAFGAVQREGCYLTKEVIQLEVHDATGVRHGSTIPLADS